MYYGCITGDQEVTKMARDYYQHANWGRKLEQHKVSFHCILYCVVGNFQGQ